MEIMKLENTITESKHTINGFDNRLDIEEQKISGLEDRSKENIQTKAEREKKLRGGEKERYI